MKIRVKLLQGCAFACSSTWPLWSKMKKKTLTNKPSNNLLSHKRVSAAEGVSKVSSPEQANEWAVRANERTDERVARYLHLCSFLFLTIVMTRRASDFRIVLASCWHVLCPVSKAESSPLLCCFRVYLIPDTLKRKQNKSFRHGMRSDEWLEMNTSNMLLQLASSSGIVSCFLCSFVKFMHYYKIQLWRQGLPDG